MARRKKKQVKKAEEMGSITPKMTYFNKVMLILAIFTFLALLIQIWPKSPQLELESLSKPSFSIQDEEPYVKFRVYNIGEKSSKSLYYTYKLQNRIENTCGENLTFFNKEFTPMCFLEIEEEGEDKKYCQSDTPPAKKDAGNYFTIKHVFSNETARFRKSLSALEINETCSIKETIALCTFYEGMKSSDWCEPINYTISVNKNV